MNKNETNKAYVERVFSGSLAEYDRIVADVRELFIAKQADYGPGNVAMGQDLSTEAGRHLSLAALAVRINDKAQRLINILLKRPLANGQAISPENESVLDSFRDLQNYAIMAQIVAKGKWGE